MQRRRRGQVVPDSSCPEVEPAATVNVGDPPAAPKIGRKRRAPVRYRALPPGDGEEFDIDDHSEVSEDGESDIPRTRTTAPNVATRAADGSVTNQSAPDPVVVNPLATNRSTTNSTTTNPLATTSSTSNRALDIEFFFRKDKDDTVCTPCE